MRHAAPSCQWRASAEQQHQQNVPRKSMVLTWVLEWVKPNAPYQHVFLLEVLGPCTMNYQTANWLYRFTGLLQISSTYLNSTRLGIPWCQKISPRYLKALQNTRQFDMICIPQICGGWQNLPSSISMGEQWPDIKVCNHRIFWTGNVCASDSCASPHFFTPGPICTSPSKHKQYIECHTAPSCWSVLTIFAESDRQLGFLVPTLRIDSGKWVPERAKHSGRKIWHEMKGPWRLSPIEHNPKITNLFSRRAFLVTPRWWRSTWRFPITDHSWNVDIHARKSKRGRRANVKSNNSRQISQVK